MRRRDVIAGLGSIAAGPVPARAQPTGMPKIGVSILANPEAYRGPLRDGLRKLGYVDGRTVQIEFRSADSSPSVLVEQTTDLVRTGTNVIVAIQTGPVKEAMKATKDIPIIMIAASPVENGLVASLSRPGSNVTGLGTLNAELGAKTLETMREIRPTLRRAAVLLNADDMAFGARMGEEAQATARTIGVDLQIVTIKERGDLEPFLQALAKQGVEVVIAQPSLPREAVVRLALKHRLPVIVPNHAWARSGALLSYAANINDICAKVAEFVDRILRGAKASDLPVQQPTQFQMVINRKTADALGITLPLSVLARADEVIE